MVILYIFQKNVDIPFLLYVGNDIPAGDGFEFLAPTTRRNALRVLRAMQLVKPGIVYVMPVKPFLVFVMLL